MIETHSDKLHQIGLAALRLSVRQYFGDAPRHGHDRERGNVRQLLPSGGTRVKLHACNTRVGADRVVLDGQAPHVPAQEVAGLVPADPLAQLLRIFSFTSRELDPAGDDRGGHRPDPDESVRVSRLPSVTGKGTRIDMAADDVVAPRRTALFQRLKYPESTSASSAAVCVAALPDEKSTSSDLARASSVDSSFTTGPTAAAADPLDVVTSFPISFDSFSYSSRALAAAARSLSTSVSVDMASRVVNPSPRWIDGATAWCFDGAWNALAKDSAERRAAAWRRGEVHSMAPRR